MVWVKIFPGETTHRCVPLLGYADMAEYGVGSVWCCDECGSAWFLKRWVTAGGSKDFVPEFIELPPLNLEAQGG